MAYKKINRANVAEYKGVTLVEPERESGVFSIFIIFSQIEGNIFPFYVIDYDTHDGIDVIAKGDINTPIASAKLFYVEFKRTLTKGFNHSNNEERKIQIISPEKAGDYTRYFLDNPKRAHKIEVFCLKTYLKEKLCIEFKTRTSDAVV